MDYAHIIQDFTRRYAQSYLFVQFPDSSEENLFYVEGIEADGSDKLAVINLTSPEYGRIKLNYGTNHTFKFKRPPSGVFQFGKDAYIFWRRPERQYKHGLCSGNSVFRAVHTSMTSKDDRNLGSTEDDYNMIKAAFDRKTFSVADACKKLASGKFRSVALNRGFSLMLTPFADANQYMLMYYDRPCALTDLNGSINKILEPSLKANIENVEHQ